MTVSKRLRYEILRRDNYTCRYCGQAAPDVKLTVDHVMPVALGGSDDSSNLVTACAACNSGKSASTPDAPIVADVAQKALQWAAAMEQVADERAASDYYRRELHEAFIAHWNTWTWTDAWGNKNTIEIPRSYGASIDQFHAAGLNLDDLESLIDVAMEAKTKDEWRYFCGCCWRRIREMQDRAMQIIQEADDAEG
jgi:hypothetical protein